MSQSSRYVSLTDGNGLITILITVPFKAAYNKEKSGRSRLKEELD